MLCIPIVGPTFFDVQKQLQEALKRAKMVEFRLDLFEEEALKSLATLRKGLSNPIIFTLRKEAQGGSFKGSEKERLEKIRFFAEMRPDYFDLEYDIPSEFIESFQKEFPKTKVILSFHDFSKTPENLDEVLKNLKKKRASLYKMSCLATSTNDSLRMLDLMRQNPSLLGMCMGEKGEITRILGVLFGAPWIYAALSSQQKTASGQLTAEELSSVYGVERLNPKSAIFGLLGSPLQKSVSRFVHNAALQRLTLNAIYVNLILEPHELEEFFPLAKKLKFQGLSVTIPLKESVLPFLDFIDKEAKEIGAVNTILFKEGKLFGYNTDGKGALEAIERKTSLPGKKVILLGAGGSARAIAYEALKRGASVTILNRTKDRALCLAKSLGAKGEGLDFLKEEVDYDILINTTPDELPIDPECLKSKKVVMDIKTVPQMSTLLKHAFTKECLLVYGYEMWVNQAIGQYEIWFSSRFDKNEATQILEKEILMRI